MTCGITQIVHAVNGQLTFAPATNILSFSQSGAVVSQVDLSSLAGGGGPLAETLTTLTFAPATSILTYTAENGIPTNIDLSGLNIAETLTTLTFAPATSILTYTAENGIPTNIDLSGLAAAPINTLNTPSVVLTGDGVNTQLQANVRISAQPGNMIQGLADGLFATATLSGATSPIGAVTPSRINEIYYQIASDRVVQWVSIGVSNTDWVAVGGTAIQNTFNPNEVGVFIGQRWHRYTPQSTGPDRIDEIWEAVDLTGLPDTSSWIRIYPQ